MSKRRGGLAADNGRGLMDELVILESFHHERGKVYSSGHVAFKNGITDVPAPYRQTLALTFFEVASAHDRPLFIAGKHPTACFYLVVNVYSAH